jgi:MFS family permease
MLLWSAGEVVGFPHAAALVAELAPLELRGRYQGAFSMCWGTSFFLAPLVGGGLLSRGGPVVLWLTCLAAGVAVAAGHLAAGPARRRRLAAERPAAEPRARSSLSAP